uniref:Uncharacterized protein n=1 Tax=Picea glauca TaxID=3330 RepID=A0A117NG40_PICGL|nr:hypothetical protein ABT39_MTgene1969 [Picea glauca]QHR91848.1 hypothetical protein Q903MT_gene5884 [Picea sitchensis]
MIIEEGPEVRFLLFLNPLASSYLLGLHGKMAMTSMILLSLLEFLYKRELEEYRNSATRDSYLQLIGYSSHQ